MKLLDELSQRLRELRQQNGLTQEEFAAVAGFSYKFYQQIEAGRKKEIWLSTVERLAKVYNLQAWELLAPSFPKKAKLLDRPKHSSVHYQRRTKKKKLD